MFYPLVRPLQRLIGKAWVETEAKALERFPEHRFFIVMKLMVSCVLARLTQFTGSQVISLVLPSVWMKDLESDWWTVGPSQCLLPGLQWASEVLGYAAIQCCHSGPKKNTSLSEKQPWTSCPDFAHVSIISPRNLDGSVFLQVLNFWSQPPSLSLVWCLWIIFRCPDWIPFCCSRLYLFSWWLQQTFKGNGFIEQKDFKHTHLSQRQGLTLQQR